MTALTAYVPKIIKNNIDCFSNCLIDEIQNGKDLKKCLFDTMKKKATERKSELEEPFGFDSYWHWRVKGMGGRDLTECVMLGEEPYPAKWLLYIISGHPYNEINVRDVYNFFTAIGLNPSKIKKSDWSPKKICQHSNVKVQNK